MQENAFHLVPQSHFHLAKLSAGLLNDRTANIAATNPCQKAAEKAIEYVVQGGAAITSCRQEAYGSHILASWQIAGCPGVDGCRRWPAKRGPYFGHIKAGSAALARSYGRPPRTGQIDRMCSCWAQRRGCGVVFAAPVSAKIPTRAIRVALLRPHAFNV